MLSLNCGKNHPVAGSEKKKVAAYTIFQPKVAAKTRLFFILFSRHSNMNLGLYFSLESKMGWASQKWFPTLDMAGWASAEL